MAVPGRAPGEILAIAETAKFNQPLLKGAYLLLFDRYHGVVPSPESYPYDVHKCE